MRNGRPAALHGNKIGITDPGVLDQASRYFSQLRVDQGLPEAAYEPTYDGFKAIHRHLFQDVFVWAGQQRTQHSGNVQARGLFTEPRYIEAAMNGAFTAFRKQNALKGLSPPEFARRAALFVCGLNEAHPFIDGNGRTQRVWLASVAERAGHRFNIGAGDRDAWNTAARKAFNTREVTHMAALIEARLRPPTEFRGDSLRPADRR